MKKFLFTALAALSLASVSQAATVLCASNQTTVFNGAITPISNIACPQIDAGGGNVIVDVAIRLFGSFQDSVQGNSHQVSFIATDGPLGTTHTINTCQADDVCTGGPSSGAFVAVGTQILAASSTIDLTSALLAGVLPDGASVTVSLEYNVAPVQTGIPEPSTLALLGSALVGIGVFARRRKQ